MLEECRLPYKVIPVNLAKGEFKPEFLSISSNNRMPAMVDADGPDGRSISIFGALTLCGRAFTSEVNRFYASWTGVCRVATISSAAIRSLTWSRRRSRNTYSDRRGVEGRHAGSDSSQDPV
jgi:hypothetical protein